MVKVTLIERGMTDPTSLSEIGRELCVDDTGANEGKRSALQLVGLVVKLNSLRF